MTMLGLVFWLLIGPGLESEPHRPPDPARLAGLGDPCLEARRIAAQGPCLRPEDCGALRSWKRLFGLPRTGPLDPQEVDRTDTHHRTATYLCLAEKADRR